MDVTITTYHELPEDVQSAVAELNALINCTSACVDRRFKHEFVNPTTIAFNNLKKMSVIVQKLMLDEKNEKED